MNIKLFITKHKKQSAITKINSDAVSANFTSVEICNIYNENMVNNTYSQLVTVNKIVGSSPRQEREMKMKR